MQIILDKEEVKTIYEALEVAEEKWEKLARQHSIILPTEIEMKINNLLLRFRPYIE